jgi:hypothetical protein
MANFSVIAKNNKLEQINNINDLQYAFEMYKYLAFEMDFPDVKLIDNETAEVLLYIKRETTSYEYISPLLMKSFQEGEENADTPIEPNEISEETAPLNYHDLLREMCMTKINAVLQSAEISLDMRVTLKTIYDNIAFDKYTTAQLEELIKTLEIS